MSSGGAQLKLLCGEALTLTVMLLQKLVVEGHKRYNTCTRDEPVGMNATSNLLLIDIQALS